VPDSRRFRVLFDDIAWAEDLHHASAAGASAAIAARAALESSGLLADDTKPCLSEGPDGTRLSGCVKVYVPAPIGPWGLVLASDPSRASRCSTTSLSGRATPTMRGS